MADNKVSIEISLEGNAQVQFKKLGDSVEEFSATTKKSFADTGRIFDNFVANLASSATTKAFDLLVQGGRAVIDIFGQGIEAAQAQEDALNQLNVALKASGQFSQAASQDLQDFASGLQATTKFADDAIVETSALIQNLAHLDRDGLKQATQAALDLATALGIDLRSAALLVGKAAEGEVGALKRYGLEIKTGATDSETFANALRKINQQFGGASQAAVNTFSGSLAQLENTYDDLLETIGQTITENPVVIQLFKEMAKVIGEVDETLKLNKTSFSQLISQGIVAMIDTIANLIPVVKIIVSVFDVWAGAIQTVINLLIRLNPILGALSLVSDQAKQLRTSLIELSSGGVERLKGAFSGSEGLDKATEVLERIRAKLAEVADQSDATTQRQIDNNNRVREVLEETYLEQVVREENQRAEKEAKQSADFDKFLARIEKENELLRKIDEDWARAQIQRNKDVQNAILLENKLSSEKRLEILAKEREAEDKIRQERYEAGKKALDDLATLQNAKSKELAAVGKAAAISSTIISTYEGATKAFAALSGIPIVGPALGAAAAAAAIVAGLARVQAIRGTPLATGITSVPQGFQNDTFPARLSSGERVISAPQNQDLTEFISGNGGIGDKLDTLIALASRPETTVVNIGGREIISVINDEITSGRALRV